MPPTKAQMARFSERDEQGPFEWRNLRREGPNSDRSARPALYYPIYISGSSIRVPLMSWDENRKEWEIQELPGPNEQIVLPDNEDGEQKTWRWEGKTVMASLNTLSLRPDRSGKDYIYYKRRPHEEGVVSVSSWFDAKYSATEHGTALLKSLFDRSPFSYPKSIYAVIDAIWIGGASSRTATVLDYFAGSGTTAHAAINLNREDGGNRKYLLVEMDDYFGTVLKPRVQKVIYSKDWKDGKPISREGSSHLFKYLRLESYEDTLNNLAFRPRAGAQLALAQSDAFREDYTLRYMLDAESRDSLLNVRVFEDPFGYTLNVATGTVGETRPVTVDMVETFNYLLGLRVRHVDAIQGHRVVQGVNPGGERVLVIWRNL
jgi:adenine-specific DNA-methyltransferase